MKRWLQRYRDFFIYANFCDEKPHFCVIFCEKCTFCYDFRISFYVAARRHERSYISPTSLLYKACIKSDLGETKTFARIAFLNRIFVVFRANVVSIAQKSHFFNRNPLKNLVF